MARKTTRPSPAATREERLRRHVRVLRQQVDHLKAQVADLKARTFHAETQCDLLDDALKYERRMRGYAEDIIRETATINKTYEAAFAKFRRQQPGARPAHA